MGDDRVLQVLDDSAQELHGAAWSVNDGERAEIRQDEDGRAVLHAKWVGLVRVQAVLGGESRFLDVRVWPNRRLPDGTSNWATLPIGREIRDLPAVPTEDGPHILSLEQTPGGKTYLRGVRDDGIQTWTWLLPESTLDVELVCGDWFGGALISANHKDSYTLYAVGKDGKLRWQHTEAGLRKGHAISTEHLLHVVSQNRDGTGTRVTGLEEFSGEQRFEIPLPASHETHVNVRKEGANLSCTSNSDSDVLGTSVSRIYVSMDGLAYVAFTQNERTVKVAQCTPGLKVDPSQVNSTWVENLILWQIHSDGTFRSTVVDRINWDQSFGTGVDSFLPTGELVTDNANGVFIPVRLFYGAADGDANGLPEDLLYRVNPDGDLIYKIALPRHEGPLHDGMVGGEETFFATRGGVLIAFRQSTGEILWQWDSKTPEISVFAALADGGCLVQMPEALVEVLDGVQTKELVKGKAMMDWQGNMYVKRN
jgi:outer membrane protein assembly factor BamB